MALEHDKKIARLMRAEELVRECKFRTRDQKLEALCLAIRIRNLRQQVETPTAPAVSDLI